MKSSIIIDRGDGDRSLEAMINMGGQIVEAMLSEPPWTLLDGEDDTSEPADTVGEGAREAGDDGSLHEEAGVGADAASDFAVAAEEVERGLVGGVLLSLGMISSPSLARIMVKFTVFLTNGEVVADPAHRCRLLSDDGDES